MASRFAAPKIVVVHAGQIIVNEGVSVQDFNGARCGQGFFLVATHDPATLNDQEGAQPLPASEDTVSHRLVKQRWEFILFRQPLVQKGINLSPTFFQPLNQFLHLSLDIHVNSPSLSVSQFGLKFAHPY
jgi:hypothetical protein